MTKAVRMYAEPGPRPSPTRKSFKVKTQPVQVTVKTPRPEIKYRWTGKVWDWWHTNPEKKRVSEL